MTLPLSAAARVHVGLCAAEGERQDLCGLGSQTPQATLLEWTQAALARGDDAGANLAVRQAPFLRGVHVVGKASRDGLPGFLADSLPDSWGRLLVDRQLRSRGVAPQALRGLDRLAIVGARGPGALVYRPEVPVGDGGAAMTDLDALARSAEVALSGEAPAEMLVALERAGGSAGGSRPKAWLAEDAAGRLRSGACALEPGEVGWLVKFRAPRHDPEDIGPLEFAYARMAAAAGLEVAAPRLFETSGGRYFASRRFDRDGPARLHVLTAAGLLDVSAEQAMAADYADLLKLTRHVTRSEVEVREAFRHAAFNVFAHNRDDHLKQFAFLRRADSWRRAPAYDLTFSDGPGGEHTLLVGGEGKLPGQEHLLRVASSAGLDVRAAHRLLDEVRGAVARWAELAREAGVGAASTARVAEAIRRACASPTGC